VHYNFVDKETYKKAKQYEERKTIITHTIKQKITLKDLEDIIARKDKKAFAEILAKVRDLEFFKKYEVLHALGFDSKKLLELYKNLS